MQTPEYVDLIKTPYALEFDEAINRAQRLGIDFPSINVSAQHDHIDMNYVAPVLQEVFGSFQPRQISAQCMAINTMLIPLLQERLGLSLTFTIGWFEDQGRPIYAHDEIFIRQLLAGKWSTYPTEGFPFHCWLTSPAYEVLDVTLATTIGEVTQNKEMTGRVISISGQDTNPVVVYHPTIVGEDFLLKCGAVIGLIF